MWQFILFRGLQGLGGGAVFPIALAVVADLYTPAERGKYLGLFGAVFGLSSLLGPAIGGLITDTFGWHWIFFVNVPIGLDLARHPVAAAPGRSSGPRPARNIDYLGAAVFAAAIAPFLIGLTNKQIPAQWTDPAVGGLILLGLVIGVVFLWRRIAGRRTRSSRWACSGSGRSRSRSRRCSWRRSGSSARSSSCRAGSRPSRAPARRNRATTSCRCSPALIFSATASGPDRRPDRPVQAADVRLDAVARRSGCS